MPTLHQQGLSRSVTSSPFAFDCQTRHGRLAAKLESSPGGGALLEYRRDTAGRLIEVRRNGMVSERYAYDTAGRRSARLVANNEGQGTSRPLQGFQRDGVPLAAGGAPRPIPETYAYSPNGLLLQAGSTRYGWDAGGSLAWRLDEPLGARGLALFDYRGGPLLRRAVLPGPTVIEYMYGPNGLPTRRLKNRRPTHDFVWLPDGRLGGCIDYSRSLMLAFRHGASGPEQVLVGILGAPGKLLLLRCWCDQIGTPRVLTAPDGTAIKEIEYDSFGNLLHDSNPALRLPLGFAGGLHDPDTGLIRFGWRDYDPRAGRFTAKDPARDLRGDGDLYDYCVDDPVSRRDPWGLSWTEATFDESKVKRDEDGKFAEKEGAGTGDGAEEDDKHTSEGSTPDKQLTEDSSGIEPFDSTRFPVTEDVLKYKNTLIDLLEGNYTYEEMERILKDASPIQRVVMASLWMNSQNQRTYGDLPTKSSDHTAISLILMGVPARTVDEARNPLISFKSFIATREIDELPESMREPTRRTIAESRQFVDNNTNELRALSSSYSASKSEEERKAVIRKLHKQMEKEFFPQGVELSFIKGGKNGPAMLHTEKGIQVNLDSDFFNRADKREVFRDIPGAMLHEMIHARQKQQIDVSTSNRKNVTPSHGLVNSHLRIPPGQDDEINKHYAAQPLEMQPYIIQREFDAHLKKNLP